MGYGCTNIIYMIQDKHNTRQVKHSNVIKNDFLESLKIILTFKHHNKPY